MTQELQGLLAGATLAECPFCGQAGNVLVGPIRDGVAVCCSNFKCLGQVQAFNPNAREKAVAAWNQRASLTAKDAEIAELKNEAELFDADHADQNRMVDRIADLIGLPHDQELDTTAFELWFSAQSLDLETAAARVRALATAVKNILPIGDASKSDSAVFPVYVTMGELRALRDLAARALHENPESKA